MNWSTVWEAVKEPLRLLALAVVSLLLTYFVNIPYAWAGIITLILRLIDSLLHEYGKETKNDLLVKGLTRF